MSNRTRLLLKNRRLQICLTIILAIVLTGIIGPFVTLDPNDYTGSKYEAPSWNHPLGTDIFGKDVLAQLVVAIRNSLAVGLISGVLGLAITIFAGGLCTYIGGKVEVVANTLANIFMVLPIIPVLIILSMSFRYRSLLVVAAIIALLTWAGSARSIRAQVLSLKERDFVKLAKISGKNDLNIVFREIFPNMLSYIFTSFCWLLGGAITAEAGISLLGLGPSGIITLGTMLHYALATQSLVVGVWWWFFPPGIILVIFTGTLLLISSVIDDFFNPKLSGAR